MECFFSRTAGKFRRGDFVTKGRSTTKKSTPPQPKRVQTNPKVLRDYERGLKLFFQKKFSDAQARFLSVIEDFPEERDVVERSRQNARTCEIRLQSGAEQLRKPEDMYYRAVLRVNNQEFDEAVQLLQKARELVPQDDRVIYLLSATHALKGDRDRALTYLREAIQIKPLNRTLAKNDPDFEEIREDREFLDTIAGDED